MERGESGEELRQSEQGDGTKWALAPGSDVRAWLNSPHPSGGRGRVVSPRPTPFLPALFVWKTRCCDATLDGPNSRSWELSHFSVERPLSDRSVIAELSLPGEEHVQR